MPEHTYIDEGGTAANTEITLDLDEPMDTREGVDPLVKVVQTLADGTNTTNNYASQGQGAAGDPAAGEVIVTGPYSIAFGDALNAGDTVTVAYGAASDNEVKV